MQLGKSGGQLLIAPERMKWLAKMEMTTGAVAVSGDGSQVRCCKEQYCIGTWNVRSMSQGKFSSVKSLSHVWLFATPRTAARQPLCLSPTPRVYSNTYPLCRWCHPTIILCRPLLLPPWTFPSFRVFSTESVLHIRWLKYWRFSLQHQSFQWIFRTYFL